MRATQPVDGTMAFRLLLLTGVFFWALWRMKSAEVAAPSGLFPLVAPEGVATAPAAGAPPEVADIAAAVDRLDGVAARAAACPAHGTIRVVLGPEGLLRAELEGRGESACVARAVWAEAWPRARQELGLEQSIPEAAPD